MKFIHAACNCGINGVIWVVFEGTLRFHVIRTYEAKDVVFQDNFSIVDYIELEK